MSEAILKRLEEEEKEAEKLLYGAEDKTFEETEERDSSESDSEPDRESEGESSSDGGDKTERTSWKKRFTSYKASTDQTIHQLRLEKSALESEIKELQSSYRQLVDQFKEFKKRESATADPLENVITSEEEELLGPEAVAVLRKFAVKMLDSTQENPKVEDLEKRLAALQKKRDEELEIRSKLEKKRELEEFKERLISAVPNFDEIDQDPKFGEYLKDVDEASGRLRVDLYKTAINGRDVLGVARFYNDFRKTRPKSKEERLEEAIVPEGRAADTQNILDSKGSKKRYHVREYETFMDDITKGIYKGREKEARKMEMLFDKAFMEGRIDYN